MSSTRVCGDAWDGLEWAEMERFEKADFNHKGITARQCRIVKKDGTEWGFQADYVAEYRRLTEVLRQKVTALRDRLSEQIPSTGD